MRQSERFDQIHSSERKAETELHVLYIEQPHQAHFHGSDSDLALLCSAATRQHMSNDTVAAPLTLFHTTSIALAANHRIR